MAWDKEEVRPTARPPLLTLDIGGPPAGVPQVLAPLMLFGGLLGLEWGMREEGRGEMLASLSLERYPRLLVT